jgi:magnesium transporter
MQQNLSVYERVFARSHSNYMAQIQVETVVSDNRMIKVLGYVTILGTIFLPMNLITGLFGMNVTVAGEQQGNLHYWFGIVFIMLGVAVALFFFCKHFFIDKVDVPFYGASTMSSSASMVSRNPRRSDPRLEIRDSLYNRAE